MNKILIVTGVVTSEHDPKVSRMLRRILESTGEFEVKITEEFRGATPETLEGYDAVLFNYDGKVDVHSPYISLGETAIKTLTDFVANGGGIIIYHSAAIAEEEDYPQEFIKMMGCKFAFSNGGRKNPKLAFRVDTVHGDPICEGMPDFWYTSQDDLFVNIKWLEDNNVEVLSTVHDALEDYDVRRMQKHIAEIYKDVDVKSLENIETDSPVIWKNTYGKGRVFVPFIGHGTDTLRRAEFCALLARGCEWACTGKVTIPFPDIQGEKRFAVWPYYDNISLRTFADVTEGA
ncbi:MAG: ThuA domain-containing protein [Pseudobutyrivibrio sp.]|nr:ThuA domain-containing protein [Pseudobutyrivibrio sp.]